MSMYDIQWLRNSANHKLARLALNIAIEVSRAFNEAGYPRDQEWVATAGEISIVSSLGDLTIDYQDYSYPLFAVLAGTHRIPYKVMREAIRYLDSVSLYSLTEDLVQKQALLDGFEKEETE